MTPKKTTPKKKVSKKTKPVVSVDFSAFSSAFKDNQFVPWMVAVLFLGLFVGTLFHGMSWSQKFSGADMFVVNGKTWLPVDGEPLALTILNDTTCGPACDPASSVQSLRQNISPALITTEVDVSSAEGKALMEKFSVKSVPQFFFGPGLASMKADDGTRFIDNLPEGFFLLKDDLYQLNNSQVGFRVGKFIVPPVFADLDTEPSRGSGPITVVEFTDYQCPFCKRLHDENKDLIDQLIAEDKITYVVKDFPLNFHTEAVEYAHAIANCTLEEAGQEAYWTMNETIFAETEQWSGKGEAGKNFLIGKANELGANVTACLADPATQLEIDADQAEGHLYGVSGTPALFIGGQVMPGAIGPDAFSQAVEAELAKQ